MNKLKENIFVFNMTFYNTITIFLQKYALLSSNFCKKYISDFDFKKVAFINVIFKKKKEL